MTLSLLQAMAGAPKGGAEGFFERLVLALQSESDMDQTTVIRRDAERAARLKIGGVDAIELPFKGRADLWTPWRLGQLLRARKPDIVLTWMNRATRMMPKGKGPVMVARLGGYYDLKYYRGCDWLVANTPGIAEYLVASGWPEDRVRVLPNFVESTPGKALSRTGFGIPESAPLLFSLGRLHVNKGFDALLDAVAKLPGVYLLLAGEGPLAGALKKQASVLGIEDRVRFLGWRRDGPDLLATCDLFVCPSRHEPFGNVVAEAWAQGVPVVSTASEGPGRMIAHGVNGMLCPLEDADALAETMQKLLDGPTYAAEIAAAGRLTYETHYAREPVVAAYKSFFWEIANRHA
ncbi:MAG: glycosyltransferase [Magnetospiraceae bacterium]